MKVSVFQLYLSVLALATSALAALSTSDLQGLVRNAGKNKAIELNDENFEDILAGSRDHHIVVLLTSDSPQINCVLCREFKPDYQLVANSWFQDHPWGLSEDEKSEGAKDVFFFVSEFTNSKKLFQTFSLNNIPKVFYFPPTESQSSSAYVNQAQEYQFFAGEHKLHIIEWVSHLTGHKFNIYVPADYTKIGLNAFITFTLVFLLKKFHTLATKVLTSKVLWSGLSLVTVLLFISGYMFNQIRGVPYLRDNGRSVEYFMPGQQNQYGIETQIMSFLYGLLSLFVIILVKKVPTIKSTSVNLIAASLFTLSIFVAYSALLCIFSIKGAGYPYKFLNLF